MQINGIFWKSGKFWLIDIPVLNLMTQAKTKKEIPLMVKDAIELLVDKPAFSVNVIATKSQVFVESSHVQDLEQLMRKRQRTADLSLN